MGVQTVRADGIAIVRFDQPGVLNALSPPMLHELIATLQDLNSEPLEGLVLTGADGTFCSGANLNSVAEMDNAGFVAFVELIQESTRLLRSIECPTVAAIEGFAIGGGVEFGLACDFRVAGSSAVFGFPEVSRGLVVTSAASRLLPLCVGLSAARQLLFLHETVDTAFAERVGLVDEVCVDGAAEQRAVDLLTSRLRAASGRAVVEMRRLLEESFIGDLSDVYQREIEASARCIEGTEVETAARDFLRERGGRSREDSVTSLDATTNPT